VEAKLLQLGESPGWEASRIFDSLGDLPQPLCVVLAPRLLAHHHARGGELGDALQQLGIVHPQKGPEHRRPQTSRPPLLFEITPELVNPPR
jgi:hypothetical protein